MSLKIITCVCGNKYASRRDIKSELVRKRPQCGICGKREYKK